MAKVQSERYILAVKITKSMTKNEQMTNFAKCIDNFFISYYYSKRAI